jgi:hypothetical protein
MEKAGTTLQHQAAIRNAAWMVRHYARGGRSNARREQAIQMLGLAVRQAFNSTEDFYPLLVAIVDGLRPRDEQEF